MMKYELMKRQTETFCDKIEMEINWNQMNEKDDKCGFKIV